MAHDLVVALVAALRPADAVRLFSHLTGPCASEVTGGAVALSSRPRAERAAALASALRGALRGEG